MSKKKSPPSTPDEYLKYKLQPLLGQLNKCQGNINSLRTALDREQRVLRDTLDDISTLREQIMADSTYNRLFA